LSVQCAFKFQHDQVLDSCAVNAVYCSMTLTDAVSKRHPWNWRCLAQNSRFEVFTAVKI